MASFASGNPSAAAAGDIMPKGPFSKLNPFPKDRNDQARVEVARAQFAQQVAQGNVGPLDRFGRKLEVGSLVTWFAPHDTVWEITKVDPVLDPNAAPGLVRLELHAAGQFNALANNVLPILIQVGHRPASIEADQREVKGMAPPSHDDAR